MLRQPKSRRAPSMAPMLPPPTLSKHAIVLTKWYRHIDMMRRIQPHIPAQVKFHAGILQQHQQHHHQQQNTIEWLRHLEKHFMNVPFSSPTWNALPAFSQPVEKNKNGRKSILYAKTRNKNVGYCVLINSKTTTAENLIEGILSTKFTKESNEEQYQDNGHVNFIDFPPITRKIKTLVKNPLFFEKIHLFVQQKNLLFIINKK